MSGEIIAIVSVGVGLALLLVGLFAWLRQDIGRLDNRIIAVESRIAELHGRMSHLEGLLEGLREAISGRAAS